MKKLLFWGLLPVLSIISPLPLSAQEPASGQSSATASDDSAASKSEEDVVRELITSNKLDEAVQQLDKWPADKAVSGLPLRSQIASMYLRARDQKKALEQFEVIVTIGKESLASDATKIQQIAGPLAMGLRLRVQQGGPQEAASWYEEQAKDVVKKLGDTAGSRVLVARALLESTLADFKTQFNLPEDSEKLDALVKELNESVATEKDNATKSELLSHWTTLRLSHAVRKLNEKVEDGVAIVDEIVAKLKENGDLTKDAGLINLAVRAKMNVVQRVMRVDGAVAKAQLTSLKELLANADKSVADVERVVAMASRSVGSIERMIEAEIKRAELVGQRAAPLDAEVFVNGEAITDDALKGKVVLLDFWAVWCGPCIATFPHLREWNEKFEKDGLVIIGVTKYYKYDWNDEQKRIENKEDLSAEDEQKALVKFAAHHELKHRFMVTPEGSNFSDTYGVTGIPQAVLIDRKGVVRLIRVGSGEENAKDLEKTIQELLAESAGN